MPALAGWRWHGRSAGAAATVIVALALWLLFRAVAIAVVGLFADEVVAAVERRHYPAQAAAARPVAFHRGVAVGLRSAGRVVNLLRVRLCRAAGDGGRHGGVLLVNGWLLGRDLGDMVARHLSTGK
ncbi:hypothetical protein AB5I41_06590 [Sphingomonas sp. MMS24-JH45]